MKKCFWITSLLVLLAGCATGYGQKGMFSGGFEETQLGPDMYSVSFSGNGSTSMARAADFTLLRSAELALENGYPFFINIEQKQWTETEVSSTPVVGSSAGGASSSAGGYTTMEDVPRIQNTIKLLKEKDSASDLVYDAQFLVDSLRAKYEIDTQ